MPNSYAGIDGCPSGWFVVQLSKMGAWKTVLARNPRELVSYIEQSTLTLIDIPIGLLDSGGPQRDCDQQARKVLGMPRAASVFSAPSRPAVYASSYSRACQLNFRRLGKKLSKQTWNIGGKIREIDELLMNNGQIRNKLRECHPEICFWALNNRTAMRFNKKKKAGREERLAVLAGDLAEAQKLLDYAAEKYKRKDLSLDDIVDAMAIAVTALLGHKALSTFPARAERDRCGLTMEICYFELQENKQ